ncbi:MAG TPA: phosphate signaling complex protein PhoU [Dehalococcoidales bacterium]|nr:phosphate signaling complex protein PhoU [Dehalococcoidales bacterium]
MKILKFVSGINFLKIIVGVIFSLAWGRIMYLIWPQPPYLTFVLFYLLAGSVIIKWVFFEIIDRANQKFKLKSVSREIEASNNRVHETVVGIYSNDKFHVDKNNPININDFQKTMQSLEENIISLGNSVKIAIARSVLSLREHDVILAVQVIDHDNEIDKTRYELENECILLIQTGHMNGNDVRKIVSILSVITELERMADYAEGIAKITLMVGHDPQLKLPEEINNMATKAIDMLQGCIESFKENDVEKAKFIADQDDQVDKQYDQVFRHLVMLMIKNPGDITKLTWLVWVAHNLERCADRVTNICERINFSVNGKIKDVKVSKY